MAGSDDPVIGIDLGTTYSCVAIFRYGKAEIIENPLGERLTPSMVAFTQHDLLVGNAAKNQAATNPSNTISEVKRLVGRNFHDKNVQDDIKLWPFPVVEGKDGKPIIKVNHKGNVQQFTAEQISAMVLSYLKEAAEKRLGREVKNAVVTVPAYFNDAQRCATRDAATIAGLNILRIINEPTAAALAYGLDKAFSGQAGKKNVLIFDLGGGTFDVTVLEIENNVMEVKSTMGDTHLGGADFDNRLVKHFAKELERTHGSEASSSPKVLRRLRTKCEQTKRMLSSSNHATINVEAMYDGADFDAEISRARFENLNLDLFENCIDLVERCLQDANMDKRSVDDVVLIGGSSRIPKIQELLKEFFGRDTLRSTINPDEAVACGAAIQAAMLTGNGVSVQNSSSTGATAGNSRSSGNHILMLRDVTPFSLGIEITTERLMSVVIPRNTPIPCTKTEVFVNSYDKQKEVAFRVYEGERAIATDNNLLGMFTIRGFKPRSEGKVKFDTTLTIDSNGILQVSAVERKSKISAAITITDDRGRLTVEERERMINEARAYRIEQEQRAKVAEAKEDLENFLYDLKNKMHSRNIKTKLDASQRRSMSESIDEALEWSDRNKSATNPLVYQYKKSELLRKWEDLTVTLQLPCK